MEKDRQHGTDGDWQQETLYKEGRALVRHSSDLRFEGLLLRRAHEAGSQAIAKNYLELHLKDDRLSTWASVKVRERHDEVELENEGRARIAQDTA